MSGVRNMLCCVVTGCLVAAGCTSVPTDRPRQLVDLPLASAYADAAFTLGNVSWRELWCADGDCQAAAEDRFEDQAKRVAERLQDGARTLYPDLGRRLPNVAAGRFEVFVVAADDAGSASTADGRIALNSALANGEPDDPWTAFVIAREMGHVIARHPEQKSLLSMATSAILNLVVPGSGLLKSAISAIGSVLAAHGKHQSQAGEADAIALRLLAASGFPLRDVARSLQGARPLPDDNRWTRSFAQSSAHLLAEARQAEAPVERSAERPPQEATEAPRLAARGPLPEALPDSAPLPR